MQRGKKIVLFLSILKVFDIKNTVLLLSILKVIDIL